MRTANGPLIAVSLIVTGLTGLIVTAAYLQTTDPALTGSTRDMDAMFIEQMIPHHDDAIEMAELALSRAEHPEIKQLAADIRTTQTAENTQMREWYGEWFGADVPEARDSSALMGGMMGAGVLDLEQLATTEPFDKAFIEAMIPHHRMGIMMSRMAGGMSGRPEMRQLTSSIIEAQGREIDEMQAWYDEWYGR